MPIIPTTAYASVEGTLTLARALINDMLVSQAGEILTDNAPFTFPMLNECADYMERELKNHGYNTFTKETVLSPITPKGTQDPGTFVNISDSGYYDGNINHNPPMLPEDMDTPLDLWERQTGSQEYWIPMDRQMDGLPSLSLTSRLRVWAYYQDAIFMPGANQSEDLRLRYSSVGLTFITPNDIIQIRGAQNALANLLAAVFVNSRDPGAAVGFSNAADAMIRQLYLTNTRSKQRRTQTRIRYGAGWNGSSRNFNR